MNPAAEKVPVARTEVVGDIAFALECRRVEENAKEEMSCYEPREEEESESDIGCRFVFGVDEEFGELSRS